MKLRTLVGASIATISLVGCAGETVVIEREVPATSQANDVLPQKSIEDIFVDTVADEYPQALANGRQWLIKFGNTICEAIDNGLTIAALAAMAVESGVDANMVGYITGAAVIAFCPENEWFLNSAGA